jgi:hypothetical protein
MNEAAMLTLIQFHGPTLAVCVALGAATAWWMFRDDRRKRINEARDKARAEQGESKP